MPDGEAEVLRGSNIPVLCILKSGLWVHHGVPICRGHTGFTSNPVSMDRPSLHLEEEPHGHYFMCPFVLLPCLPFPMFTSAARGTT